MSSINKSIKNSFEVFYIKEKENDLKLLKRKLSLAILENEDVTSIKKEIKQYERRLKFLKRY